MLLLGKFTLRFWCKKQILISVLLHLDWVKWLRNGEGISRRIRRNRQTWNLRGHAPPETRKCYLSRKIDLYYYIQFTYNSFILPTPQIFQVYCLFNFPPPLSSSHLYAPLEGGSDKYLWWNYFVFQFKQRNNVLTGWVGKNHKGLII